ncbi:unnamed protein product [Acanthoscelides obtectus]|uniref:EF-hand domain-containing protein n=1 Tax=Acanthoscelides obtectus TaxID=200917 RepID=A0A9P0KF80_ACAOB|nr:unnamed protein product [Acanthoscelides obtectus]CAK1651070.1 hypothetical protein AOBTE_LOCUS17038 [Acanthoscelides obtectus]
MNRASLQKAIGCLLDTKESFGKRDFVILCTAIFGEEPSEEEIESFFKKLNKDCLNFQDVEKFCNHKAHYMKDTEMLILEIFRAVDKDAKCYITGDDIVNAWKDSKIRFNKELVIECFNLVACEENIIDYFTFRDLYLSVNRAV